MLGPTKTTYRAGPGISWVVQAEGVSVLDEIARTAIQLDDAEAVVWELLLRGHDCGRAGAMLQAITGRPADDAVAVMQHCLRKWRAAGWIVADATQE
jgi:hypothetical protein